MPQLRTDSVTPNLDATSTVRSFTLSQLSHIHAKIYTAIIRKFALKNLRNMLTVKLGVDKQKPPRPLPKFSDGFSQGQVSPACVVSDAPEEQDYIEMVQVSEQVAYQRKHDGESSVLTCW